MASFKPVTRGARRGGRVEDSPPPEAEKIVVEKWFYFPEVYKMTKVLEDGIENGKKSIFHFDYYTYM